MSDINHIAWKFLNLGRHKGVIKYFWFTCFLLWGEWRCVTHVVDLTQWNKVVVCFIPPLNCMIKILKECAISLDNKIMQMAVSVGGVTMSVIVMDWAAVILTSSEFAGHLVLVVFNSFLLLRCPHPSCCVLLYALASVVGAVSCSSLKSNPLPNKIYSFFFSDLQIFFSSFLSCLIKMLFDILLN